MVKPATTGNPPKKNIANSHVANLPLPTKEPVRKGVVGQSRESDNYLFIQVVGLSLTFNL